MVIYYKAVVTGKKGKRVGFSVNVVGHTSAISVKKFKSLSRRAAKSNNAKIASFKRISAKEAARLSMKTGRPIINSSSGISGARLVKRRFKIR